MRYTYILKSGKVFQTEYLIFPDWSQVSAIIAIHRREYTNLNHWAVEDCKPVWVEIAEDHL